MRASYSTYKIDNDTVFIVDENGRVSITNDAEAVVAEVNMRYPNRRIIYKDSEGEWGELVHDNGRFIKFGFL